MNSAGDSGLTSLAKLNPNEVKILNVILSTIKNNNGKPAEMEKVVNSLSHYPLKLLYALSERSPEINALLETNDYLNTCWSAMLAQLEYPSIPIESFDGQKKISLFSQLKGAFLLSELNKYPDLRNPNALAMLNKACEIGMFHALIQRLNYFTGIIMQSDGIKRDQEELDTYIQYILNDVHRLSNLYWAIGCIDSALILFNVVNYYFEKSDYKIFIERFFATAKTMHFSWMTAYTDKNTPYPIRILEAAVENLYIARLLTDYPQSKEISDQITHGRGLLAGHEEHFTNSDELQKLVMKELNMLQLPLVESFCRRAYQQAAKIINDQYPDMELPSEAAMLR